MRIYKILFFSVLVFLSCHANQTPQGLLSKEQMVNILTGVHIIDGQLAAQSQVPDSLYKYGTGQYLQVFKQYHTDSLEFRKSFSYYTQKPDQLSDIYDEVVKNIQSKKDSLTKVTAKSSNALPRK